MLSHAHRHRPDGWVIAGDALHRELKFADFSEAWGFMNRVALTAEEAAPPELVERLEPGDDRARHPRRGDTVTDKDVALAEAINGCCDAVSP